METFEEIGQWRTGTPLVGSQGIVLVLVPLVVDVVNSEKFILLLFGGGTGIVIYEIIQCGSFAIDAMNEKKQRCDQAMKQIGWNHCCKEMVS